jgi:TonB family protein
MISSTIIKPMFDRRKKFIVERNFYNNQSYQRRSKNMSVTSFYRTKTARLLFSVLPALLLAAVLASPEARAQQSAPRQLTLADIIIGLKSNKVTLPERNKILSEAVIERGITFALTAEIENELFKTGADKALVDAIRQKSQIVKTSVPQEVPKPKPTPAVSSQPDYTFYQKRADENIGKGEYDLAIVDYNKVIEMNPKSVPAYFNRARAFYIKRDFPAAVESYTKVLELTPEDSVVYYNRGVAYEKMGDLEKAVADYEKAIELDANNEPAQENLRKIREAELAKKQPPVVEPPKVEQPAAAPTPSDAGPTVFNHGRIDASLAIKMTTPYYPPIARNMNAEGQVVVEVEIDEEGNVTSAKATSGHNLLRASAEEAALKSRFKPAIVNGVPVKAVGQIIYNFKR